eukprot:EG_transcript_1611
MSECNRMFRNIEDLIAVSTCLLIRLNDEVSRCEEQNRDMADIPLGTIFLNMVKPHLEEFSAYCYHYQKDIERTFHRLNQRKPFRNFISEQEVNAIPLTDLLRLPLSRIGKYHYFFRQMLRCSDDDDPDVKNIRSFAQLCSDHTQAIHTSILSNSNEQRLKGIAQRVAGLNFSLTSPGRRYIYEGALMKNYSRGLHYRYFFLFSDMLLYCTGTDCARGDGLKFKDRIFLISDPPPYAESIEDDDLRQRYNGFHILTGKMAITLYADSPEEKTYWMGLLQEALHALKVESSEQNRRTMDAQLRSTSSSVELKKKLARESSFRSPRRERPASEAQEEATKEETRLLGADDHPGRGSPTDGPDLPDEVPRSPADGAEGKAEAGDVRVKRPKQSTLTDGLRELAGVLSTHSRLPEAPDPHPGNGDALSRASPSLQGLQGLRGPTKSRLRSKSLEEDGGPSHRRPSHRAAHSRAETLFDGGVPNFNDWLESPRSVSRGQHGATPSSALGLLGDGGPPREKRRLSMDDAPFEVLHHRWALRGSPKMKRAESDSEGSNDASVIDASVGLGHATRRRVSPLHSPVAPPPPAAAAAADSPPPVAKTMSLDGKGVGDLRVAPPPPARLQRPTASTLSTVSSGPTEYDLGEREKPRPFELPIPELPTLIRQREEASMIDLTETVTSGAANPILDSLGLNVVNPFREPSRSPPPPPPLGVGAATPMTPTAPLARAFSADLNASSSSCPATLGVLPAPVPADTVDSFASLQALASTLASTPPHFLRPAPEPAPTLGLGLSPNPAEQSAANPSAISGTDPRPAAITFGPSLLELPSVDTAVPPPPLAALAEGFPHSRSTLQLALEHSSPVLRTEHSGSYLSTESDSPAHLAALEERFESPLKAVLAGGPAATAAGFALPTAPPPPPPSIPPGLLPEELPPP